MIQCANNMCTYITYDLQNNETVSVLITNHRDVDEILNDIQGTNHTVHYLSMPYVVFVQI